MKPFVLATVTYNRLEMVKPSITSWLDTIDEQLYNLIIVDNGSTDGTAEWVIDFAAKTPHVSAILLDHNFGTAVALNLAWQRAPRGAHLGKADSDIVIHTPDFLPRILSSFQSAPDIGIIGLRRKDLMENPYHANPWYRSKYLDLKYDCETIHMEIVSHCMGSWTIYNSAAIEHFGYLAQLQEDRWPDPAYGFDDALACYRMKTLGFKSAFLRGWDDVSVEISHIDPGEGDKPDGWNGVYTRWKQAEAGTWMARYKELARGYTNGTVSPYYDAEWDFAITKDYIIKVID